MKRKKQVLLSTVLLVCIVFAVGIIIGNTWQSADKGVSKILRQSELDAESFLIEQELFESFETNCGLAEQRLSSLTNELWQLGKVLGTEDAKDTLGEETYRYLKLKYHLMQIRTYSLDKRLQDDCGKRANVILYYYTRTDPYSAQQGQILDDLGNEYNLHVFAIEYNYSKELAFLEDYYAITGAPTLVVNFEHLVSGVATKDALIPLLHG